MAVDRFCSLFMYPQQGVHHTLVMHRVGHIGGVLFAKFADQDVPVIAQLAIVTH